jgi:hypothetical protein
MKFNENRLLEYHEFLANYPWRENSLPAEAQGLLKVITQLLEEEEV